MKLMRFLSLILPLVLTSLFATNAYAKQVALFEKPNKNAKVVGTVDLAAGIIPIFTPKNSKWVKIADPRNGNVGWVKANDLSKDGSSVRFSTKFIADDDKNTHETYQIIEFGNAQAPSKKQRMHMKQLQKQQEALQHSVNQSLENMMKDMNKIYHQYWQMMNESGMPIVMPIMLQPPKAKTEQEQKKKP